jgi:hypothetical protein
VYRCPGGPNITSLRAVRPRWACEPGSAGPSYASTSVSRTLTPACVNVAPSSRGATSSTGRASTSVSDSIARLSRSGQLPARIGRRSDRRMPTPSRSPTFGALASTYDQTGMPFVRPVGARLVELLAPQPGDRGHRHRLPCGAATVPLGQVQVEVADADDLGPRGPFDVVTASLVLSTRAPRATTPFSSADATRAVRGAPAPRCSSPRRRSRCRSRTSRTGSASRVRRDRAPWGAPCRTRTFPRLRARAAEILDGPLVWEVRFWIAGL